MFTLLFILSHQVQSCSTQCQDLCLSRPFSSSCLEACACPSALSSYSWHCAQETTKQCEKSPNFETCMLSSNCKLSQIKSPGSASENLINVENTQSLGKLSKSPRGQVTDNGPVELVTCADCKIFQGDDYWECVAEYCESNSIEFSLCPNCGNHEKHSKSQKSSNSRPKLSPNCEPCTSSDPSADCPADCELNPQERNSAQALATEDTEDTQKPNPRIKTKPVAPNQANPCTKVCSSSCEGSTCVETCSSTCGSFGSDVLFVFKIAALVVLVAFVGELALGACLIGRGRKNDQFQGEYKIII